MSIVYNGAQKSDEACSLFFTSFLPAISVLIPPWETRCRAVCQRCLNLSMRCTSACRKLVTAGVGHLFLNISCGLISFGIGVDTDLDTALALAVLCAIVLNLLSLGEDLLETTLRILRPSNNIR